MRLLMPQVAIEAVPVGGTADATAPAVQLTVGSGAANGTTVTAVGTTLDPDTGDLVVSVLTKCLSPSVR